MELNYGTLYCFKCRDYIYDAALDEISRSIDQQLAHKNYHISRQPVAYVAWEPTNDEIDLLKKNPKRKRVEPGSTIGELLHVCSCSYQYYGGAPLYATPLRSENHLAKLFLGGPMYNWLQP